MNIGGRTKYFVWGHIWKESARIRFLRSGLEGHKLSLAFNPDENPLPPHPFEKHAEEADNFLRTRNMAMRESDVIVLDAESDREDYLVMLGVATCALSMSGERVIYLLHDKRPRVDHFQQNVRRVDGVEELLRDLKQFAKERW